MYQKANNNRTLMYACTNKQIHVGYSPVGKEVSLQLDETRSGFVKDVHVLVLSASQRKKNTPQKKQNKQNQNKIFKKCSLKRVFF